MPPTYDAVLGADQTAVNGIISELYTALLPSGIFKRDIEINQVNITTITINITKPLTVDFQTPSHLASALTDNAKNNAEHEHTPKEAAGVDAMLAAIDNVSFSVVAPAIDITIRYKNGKSTLMDGAILSLGAMLSTDAKTRQIKVQLSSGDLSFGDTNKDVDEIISGAIIPFVIAELNDAIFKPIAIPPLEFGNAGHQVSVSIPVPVAQPPYLMAFTALGTTPPTVPDTFPQWPAGAIFVSLDPTLITAAANASIPDIAPAPFEFTPFSGCYGVKPGTLNMKDVTVNQDGSIHAVIGGDVYTDITFHGPFKLPKRTWSPSAKVTIGVKASARVAASNVVEVVYHALDKPDIHFAWGDLDWTSFLHGNPLNALADELASLILPRINAKFKDHAFEVYTIPPIDVPVAPGATVRISMSNVRIAAVEMAKDPGNMHLVMHGLPDITHL